MMEEECLLHRMSRQTSYALTGNRTWRHTLLQRGYGTLWMLHTTMCAIHYIARPPVGRDCMMLRLSIANFRWGRGCLLPSGGPKEVGIPLDWTPAGSAQGDRSYGGHLKGYAVLHGLKTFATTVRKWARPLTAFPTSRFQTPDWQLQCRSVLRDIYSHLCLTDMAVKTALLESGPRPFSLPCLPPLGDCLTRRLLNWARTL